MPIRTTVLAAFGLGLAGCAPTAPQPGDLAGAVQFQCPKPGTRATYGTSRRPVVFDGADPADPMVCLATNPNGTTARRVGNLQEVPAGQFAAVRDGLAQVFPLAPGRTARFSYFQGYMNDPTKTGQFRETWTTVGPETLQVGGKPVETVVVTRELEDSQPYGSVGIRWKLWYARDSGVWVKGEPTVLRGDATVRPFAATSIAVP